MKIKTFRAASIHFCYCCVTASTIVAIFWFCPLAYNVLFLSSKSVHFSLAIYQLANQWQMNNSNNKNNTNTLEQFFRLCKKSDMYLFYVSGQTHTRSQQQPQQKMKMEPMFIIVIVIIMIIFNDEGDRKRWQLKWHTAYYECTTWPKKEANSLCILHVNKH